jgi:hypothetical protein
VRVAAALAVVAARSAVSAVIASRLTRAAAVVIEPARLTRGVAPLVAPLSARAALAGTGITAARAIGRGVVRGVAPTELGHLVLLPVERREDQIYLDMSKGPARGANRLS